MATVEQRVQTIINSLPNKKAGYNWRALCKSSTAFIKTWRLGRAGRRLAFLAAQSKKNGAKNGSRGYVIARHALIALEKLAHKVRSVGGQMIADFIHFILMLGIWAARAVVGVIDLPLRRRSRFNSRQKEFTFDIFWA